MKSPSAGLVTLSGPSPNLKKSMVTVTEFLLLLKLKTTFYLKVHFMFHTSFGQDFQRFSGYVCLLLMRRCHRHNTVVLVSSSGLSVDIGEDDLKYALEGIEGTGQLKVQWRGSCRRPKWRVEWLTKPGDQPMFQVCV